MEKQTIEERLNDQLNASERKVDKLEEELDDIKYRDEWHWRQIRKLTKEENLDLPLPRLEIRYRKFDDYNVIADYALVHEHLLGDILFVPMSSTKIGSYKSMETLDLPFRDGAHIRHDMWHMEMPGYVVSDGNILEISNEDVRDLPHALRDKIGK